MLDKSVPFIPFTMFRPSDAPPLPEIQLPKDYRIVFINRVMKKSGAR